MSLENSWGQVKADSLKTNKLDEVVVTATRSERQMGALPMPVSVVGQKQIKAIGALRLNDVLAEQTGLFIVNDHGNGVQIQGFSPDYTLILVDGEPLIGRMAGTLELSRLAVGNIKQIEIVKGPSSSLYGSEALAGVVNIITENPERTKGNISLRYGTNQTSDISGNIAFHKQKVGFSLFGNRFSSGGYSLTPDVIGQTVSPFQNFTLQPKLTINFTEKTKLSISSRLFTENQDNTFSVAKGAENTVSGFGKVNEFTLNPSVSHKFNSKFNIVARLYNSRYRTDSKLSYEQSGKVYDETFFEQTFLRPEIQSNITFNQKNLLTVGVGMVQESVEATRYDDKKQFNTKYLFAQYEYFPTPKLHFILGTRYDAHSAYTNQLSPKISARYELSPQFALRASAGVGYKAPDFRQLYLNFTNAVAGYSVFGSQELASNLAILQSKGQVSEVLINPSDFGELRPESSTAFNIGTYYSNTNGWKATVNLFRNDIKDLIETQSVARKTNAQSVFSYRNINQVFTQGAEIEGSKIIEFAKSSLQFSLGYQYLEAKDKDVITKLEDGNVFRRDPITLITERVPKSDYGGLLGRSRHSANFKIFFDAKNGWSASLRGLYRGRYGIADRNSNAILDADNEYVTGYWLWNLSVAKTYKKLTAQTGIDNILGFTDAVNIPNIAGRLAWVKLSFDFGK